MTQRQLFEKVAYIVGWCMCTSYDERVAAAAQGLKHPGTEMAAIVHETLKKSEGLFDTVPPNEGETVIRVGLCDDTRAGEAPWFVDGPVVNQKMLKELEWFAIGGLKFATDGEGGYYVAIPR